MRTPPAASLSRARYAYVADDHHICSTQHAVYFFCWLLRAIGMILCYAARYGVKRSGAYICICFYLPLCFKDTSPSRPALRSASIFLQLTHAPWCAVVAQYDICRACVWRAPSYIKNEDDRACWRRQARRGAAARFHRHRHRCSSLYHIFLFHVMVA